MDLFLIVDELCDAIDAGHTGCDIEITEDDVRVLTTFSYPCAANYLVTDVLRAVAAPDWRKALADAQTALQARILGFENRRKAEEEKKGVRLRVPPISRETFR